ncbi:hypothetical protein [Actinacidiphila acididurans]|uniref:Orc1-like AAA ATPase domain-containing protein n=1 Tax=Actinacidiphila acididurans TaxID=2784346 RepID=A0ABS2U0F9_9ACTN|nr:hypothetical protein [Actinacidiphila acididurans]MBM9508025.1 hypothetical protein [Actinacidiphila acididurans]
MKGLLYEVYRAAGTPSLDEIVKDITEDNELPGAPGRDTVRRCISDPTVPPRQADVVAIARVLARRAAMDADDLAARIRNLWVEAGTAQAAGRPIGEFDDRLVMDDLEVHPSLDTAVGQGLDMLPAYVPRSHDNRLAAVVQAAREGRSGIVVLVGGSSTGKTRALWDAVKGLPHGWRLWHPLAPTRADALLAGLINVAPQTVVWLNEAQDYLQPAPLGEQVAAGLRTLLNDPVRGPVLVVATLWPGHWETLTASGAAHAQARELLSGHEIHVPDAFTQADLARLAEYAPTDPRLRAAADHAADAQIAQYLAGAPVLLARYRASRGITRGLIHAAMDARRLGAGPYLPLAWLVDAAPAYLTDTEWNAITAGGMEWLASVLEYLTPRDGVPGILTPVSTGKPRNQRISRARTGSPEPTQGPRSPLYQLADYLGQHARTERRAQIPPIGFWTAAAMRAHPADKGALGRSAQDRGLYRDAAQLYKYAAHHDPISAAALIRLLHSLSPLDRAPAQWAAAEVDLTNPDGAADLLDALSEVGATEQTMAVANRVVAEADLTNPDGAASLLDALGEAGATEQTTIVANRVAIEADLTNPDSAASLLGALREAGATEQATSVANRVAIEANVSYPGGVASLLEALREAGATEQTTIVANRVVAEADLTNPDGAADLLDALSEVGATEQIMAVSNRVVAEADLTNPDSAADFLNALREAGATEQTTIVANRVAIEANVSYPGGVASLLEALREAGATEQTTVLLSRNPAAEADLTNPDGVASLLEALREAGASEQTTVLLSRNPAAEADLTNPDGVASLLEALREAGASEQTTVLLSRVAAGADLTNPDGLFRLLGALREAGATEQISVVANRVAAGADLTNSDSLFRLLGTVREAGAAEHITALSERLPGAGRFHLFIRITGLTQKYLYGREPDGTAADAWTWSDLG